MINAAPRLQAVPPRRRQLDALRVYLRKQPRVSEIPNIPAHADLAIVVVIPCYDEPDVLRTVESLLGCRRPRGAVEVLLVWNASEDDDAALRSRNQAAMEAMDGWRSLHDDPRFRFHTLNFPRLPARHAGVGLARKIGMDAAAARFADAGNPDGVIACLDADCACDDNYLVALESHFERHPDTGACTVYFEHALSGPLDQELYRAITHYELFLRYYRHGLRFARFPFAYYSVGSCLAIRCDFYARQGGMNRRKAGEDFYFLNKLLAVGGVSENTATRVMPGVRLSTRVPFGTGRALIDRTADPHGDWATYDPRVFRDLAALVSAVDSFYGMAAGRWRMPAALPPAMVEFLEANRIADKHGEIRANCVSPESFRKRFFRWFDGFRALKFIHYATQHAYSRLPLEQACATLLDWEGQGSGPQRADIAGLLLYFRDRDRRS